MKTILFNIIENKAGEMRYGNYMVDGQAGALPEYLVELEVIETTPPEYDTATEIAFSEFAVDLENKTYTLEWDVRDLTESELKELNPTPIEVPAWRLKAVLTMTSELILVENFLNVLPEPSKAIALLAWNNGTTIRRDSSTISALSESLEWDQEKVDSIFKQAMSINI